MHVFAITLAFLLSITAVEAQAAKNDIMPPPQKAPRIPVERESLKEPKEFEGKAKAIDGERIMVGEKEIRLFGIVTPGISSNYGPQVRQRLDQIIKGEVLCKVTDKDGDGRPIAFCGTVDTPDLSYEMLRQGWAMADRKALKNNSLADVYEKVEQEAQSLNKGLFAPLPMVASVPVSNPSNTLTVPLNQPASQPAPAVQEKPQLPASIIIPITTVTKAEPEKAAAVPAQEAVQEQSEKGIPFVERYQALLGAAFWVMGALGFGGILLLRDKTRLKEKRKALAAALHGELMAARQICRTKSRELIRQRRIGHDDGQQPRPSQLWPRMRTFVFQAHVGSIGLLGSDLARRVASIYGQCADYAVYYQQSAMQRMPSNSAVSERLSVLADHIEGVLDSLSQVENSGKVYMSEAVEDVSVSQNDDAQIEDTEEEAKIVKARFERMAQSMMTSPMMIKPYDAKQAHMEKSASPEKDKSEPTAAA